VKIAIFGAGATGGLLGAELALAGADVTLIARGPHLAAMRENGITLIRSEGTRVARPLCTDNPAAAGPQDIVIVTLKANAVPGAVEAMAPLLGPDTAVVTAMNGIPYWYFHGVDGPHRDRTLESVDPGGRQWDVLGPERAIGCVVYPATEVVEPGVIRHIAGDRFVLGEPDGSRSERVTDLARVLIDAGFRAPVRNRIRHEIWAKLWGNLAFNPVSALTGGTLVQIATTPDIRSVVRGVMIEAEAVAEALGITFPIDVDARIDEAGAVGAHKTSMLQDLERGRPMEIDPVVGAVSELGRLAGVPTPNLDAVLALVRLRARTTGLA